MMRFPFSVMRGFDTAPIFITLDAILLLHLYSITLDTRSYSYLDSCRSRQLGIRQSTSTIDTLGTAGWTAKSTLTGGNYRLGPATSTDLDFKIDIFDMAPG